MREKKYIVPFCIYLVHLFSCNIPCPLVAVEVLKNPGPFHKLIGTEQEEKKAEKESNECREDLLTRANDFLVGNKDRRTNKETCHLRLFVTT